MTIQIRAATVADSALIQRLITELAIYEKAEHEVAGTAETTAAHLFAADSPARALICEVDGEPVGYAVYFFSYSTWLARKGLYLEDIYVTPTCRGVGAGKQMLRHLAQLACESGCGRFEWSVLDWNTPAIDFYESIGARPQSEWVRYRMAGADLHEFAGGAG